MNHQYIDEWGIADRYVKQTLPAEHLAAFKAHLMNCEECTDRVLLAEMFHHRNGSPPPAAPPAKRVELLVTTVQMAWIILAVALLLLVVLMILFLLNRIV